MILPRHRFKAYDLQSSAPGSYMVEHVQPGSWLPGVNDTTCAYGFYYRCRIPNALIWYSSLRVPSTLQSGLIEISPVANLSHTHASALISSSSIASSCSVISKYSLKTPPMFSNQHLASWKSCRTSEPRPDGRINPNIMCETSDAIFDFLFPSKKGASSSYGSLPDVLAIFRPFNEA